MINVDAPTSAEAPVTPEAPAPEITKKFRAKHDAAIKAVEAARTQVELGRKALEIAKADKKDWFQLQLESREAKLIEAKGALANINLTIGEEQEKQAAIDDLLKELEDKLAEYLGTDQLIATIEKYGTPIYYTQRTSVLNEAFWGGVLLRDRHILYSPAHADWYDYNPITGCGYPVTEDGLCAELHEML